MTTISIFGLGYVGAVSAACLAQLGHRIIGVDVSAVKVETINAGRSPIVEHGLDELMREGVESGCIQATSDAMRAVEETDISLVCVGTPSRPNGSLDLTAVGRVAESIAMALARKDRYHVLVVRSTMLPGSTDERIIPVLEEFSNRRLGDDFGVAYNPEFLREGSSIRDFHEPPYTIIGGSDDRALDAVAELYAGVSAPVHRVPIRVAEMLKYVNNAFHALKIAFANEVGVICKRQGIDSHAVMELFIADRKLNISPAYLRPGFAFGGSCLPKDLRALTHHARGLDVAAPVLEAVLPSNERHIDRAYELVRATGQRKVAVLGLSFKAGTDDLRESPLVELVERLIGKGYDVSVYDRNVSIANLHGTNRAYIEQEIPHIVSIMSDSLDDMLAGADVVVVGNNDPEYATALSRAATTPHVIDLVRVADSADGGRYQGIAW